MWSGAGAPIGVVAKLVDVYASLGRSIATFDVVGNGSRGGFGGLLEGNRTTDGGVAAKDCNCCALLVSP